MKSLQIAGRNGKLVALRELVRVEKTVEDKSIYHKNLMPVTYVTADVAGAMESPVYAILKLGPEIDKIKIPEGYQIQGIRTVARRGLHARPSLWRREPSL